MNARITPPDVALSEALGALLALQDRCGSQRLAVQQKLSELRRQARARGRRRADRRPSADEMKYRLGSAILAAGGGGLDDVALLGLLANGDMALRWLAEARRTTAGPGLMDLIARILEDPGRREWCRQWGGWFWWEHNHALYQAEVGSFLASRKADTPNAKWRSRPATSEQLYLIETISSLLGCETPADLDRGEAFDWIREKGGNPRYWAPPSRPP